LIGKKQSPTKKGKKRTSLKDALDMEFENPYSTEESNIKALSKLSIPNIPNISNISKILKN